VTATTAAASSPRPVALRDGERRIQNVTTTAASAMTMVMILAAGGTPRTAPRNVSGSMSRAIVPPGE